MSTVMDTKAAATSELNLEKQQELKVYLDTFYDGIHETRMFIQFHTEVANAVKSGSLMHTQFWACMQKSVYVSLVVGCMFAIFDDGYQSTIKKFVRFLRSEVIYNIEEKDVSGWINAIQAYEEFRNKIIAHTTTRKPLVPDVEYTIFLELLSQFESKLIAIQKKFITHHTLLNCEWSAPEIRLNNAILVDMRKVLELCTAVQG